MTGPSRGADRTEIHEIQEPRPGPGEVSIDVAYAGINFVDVMARRGDAAYASAWPYAAGLEVSGAVRETGPGVTELAVGQQVAAFTAGGGLAAVARTRAEFVVPVPGQLSLAVAAAAPLMLTTGLLLLSDAARFRPGESVLVHSASGGVGSAIAQLVPALGGGLRIGTVGRPGKVASALASGYDVAMARTGDVAGAVREATGGAGADIVLDGLPVVRRRSTMRCEVSARPHTVRCYLVGLEGAEGTEGVSWPRPEHFSPRTTIAIRACARLSAGGATPSHSLRIEVFTAIAARPRDLLRRGPSFLPS